MHTNCNIYCFIVYNAYRLSKPTDKNKKLYIPEKKERNKIKNKTTIIWPCRFRYIYTFFSIGIIVYTILSCIMSG